MQAGWYIDGEAVSAAEVRALVLDFAGRSWEPSSTREQIAGELRSDAYADIEGKAVEVVYPDHVATWDERAEYVSPVTTMDAGPEVREMRRERPRLDVYGFGASA